MNKIHHRRIWQLSFILLGLALAMLCILYGLRQNVNLYFTPTQLKAQAPGIVTEDKTIKIGGLVARHSIHRALGSLSVKFFITDGGASYPVHYRGVLPDLFREGQGVVVEGHLMPDGLFQADRVLAKHDENYAPPGIKEKINRATKEAKHAA